MRILVISDSHGRNDDIEGVLKQVGDIDMMIHCGDVERGDSYIREIADCPWLLCKLRCGLFKRTCFGIWI